jgi:hypothetical protein
MNQAIAHTVSYVAIQQIKGPQPTAFMKLARPYGHGEIVDKPGSSDPCIQLDPKWMVKHGFSVQMVQEHCATSEISTVEMNEDGILLIKTRNSIYQAIPDFA